MKSGNENGSRSRTGTGMRLTNIEDILMVFLTIITCSKIAHVRSIYISMLPPIGLFPSKGNGAYLEPFHEKA